MGVGLNLSPNLLGVKRGQGARFVLAATLCHPQQRARNASRQLSHELLATIQGMDLRHTGLCLADRRECILPTPAANPSLPEQSLYPWMGTGSRTDGICWTAETQEETAE